MQLTALPTKEAAIIARLGIPDRPSLSPEAAEALLAVGFSEADKDRMNVLAAKARAGTLTPDESAEAEAYSRVGSLLGILKSKARQSLKQRRGTKRKPQPH
jgi:hypothetical protein